MLRSHATAVCPPALSLENASSSISCAKTGLLSALSELARLKLSAPARQKAISFHCSPPELSPALLSVRMSSSLLTSHSAQSNVNRVSHVQRVARPVLAAQPLTEALPQRPRENHAGVVCEPVTVQRSDAELLHERYRDHHALHVMRLAREGQVLAGAAKPSERVEDARPFPIRLRIPQGQRSVVLRIVGGGAEEVDQHLAEIGLAGGRPARHARH